MSTPCERTGCPVGNPPATHKVMDYLFEGTQVTKVCSRCAKDAEKIYPNDGPPGFEDILPLGPDDD